MKDLDRVQVKEVLDRIAATRVLVVGDIMLDRYWWGDVTRISPEAPVPVVRLRENSHAAGGAANVAANVAGLGAEAILVGAVGRDADADTFRRLLAKMSIDPSNLFEMDRCTTVKTRIIAHSQQVVRVDQEVSTDLTEEETSGVLSVIEKLIPTADAVIVSDYGKGFLTQRIVERMIEISRENRKPVLVDPKGRDYSKYAGASVITPNRREAAEACRLDIEATDLVEKAGEMLLSSLNLDAVLITRSEDGMTLFRKNTDPENLQAVAREIYDVTGAGDTVIACLGAAIGAGAEYAEAARIANLGAGLVVEQIGTTHITSERILGELDHVAKEAAKSVRDAGV